MAQPMTWEQIGEVEGISGGRAAQIFDEAVTKLRRRFPNALDLMAAMVDELEDNRRQTGVVQPWD